MLSAYWPDPQIEAHERRNPIARDARPLQPLVRPAGRPLQGRHRLGARPPAGDGRCSRSARSSARSRCRSTVRRRRLRAGERPQRDQHRSWRRRRARTSSTRGSRRRRSRGWRARTRRSRYTYTTLGSSVAARRGVDTARIYVRLMPKAERDVSQEALGADAARRSSQQIGGAHGVPCSPAASAAACKQIQLQLQGPDARTLTTLAERDRGRGAQGAGRGGRRPLDRGAEAGARGGAQPRPGRHARRHASGRSRSRCARRSPGSTPATGSIPSGETRDVTRPPRARGARARRRPRAAARSWCRRRAAAAARHVVPLGQVAHDPRRRRARRRSTTSTATRWSSCRPTSQGRSLGEVIERHQRRASPGCSCRRATASPRAARSEDQSEVFGSIFTALGSR